MVEVRLNWVGKGPGGLYIPEIGRGGLEMVLVTWNWVGQVGSGLEWVEKGADSQI